MSTGDSPVRSGALSRLGRTMLYVLVAPVPGVLGALPVLLLLLTGSVLLVSPLGLWVIALAIWLARQIGSLHLKLMTALLGMQVDPAARRSRPGLLGWRRDQLAAWRALSFVLLKAPLSLASLLVAGALWGYGFVLLSYPLTREWNAPLHRDATGAPRRGLAIGNLYLDSWFGILLVTAAGLGLLLLAPGTSAALTRLDHRLAEALLGRSALSRRVEDLEASRADAVDTAASTLRRIERDLHDGTQARLVALALQLAMARETLAAETTSASVPRTRSLIDRAHGQAIDAVNELRGITRGIHPAALDLGLGAALDTLATSCSVPVQLDVEVGPRPAPAIESILYFCAAELLTNAVRHSSADRIWINVSEPRGNLRLLVGDNGHGGAMVGSGSGLSGLARRVRTVDGALTVHSPVGGPTVVTVDLPHPG